MITLYSAALLFEDLAKRSQPVTLQSETWRQLAEACRRAAEVRIEPDPMPALSDDGGGS